MIAPMTATSGAGNFLLSIPPPTITIRTAAETATVGQLASGMSLIALKACTMGPLPLFVTPSMPASCSHATWMPTPVRKPIRTDLERKSARNPSLSTRARIRKPAARIAVQLASWTHSDVFGVASPVRPANMIAAVAESAPTTRCREEPSSANTAIGSRIVYRPVMTGMPAILV